MSIKFDWKNLSDVEKKVEAELNEQNKVLLELLDERETITVDQAKEKSQKKYFKNPKLKDDNGDEHDGWEKALPVLKEKEGKAAIDETKVDISFKLKDPNAESDNDLAMEVKTKISFKSAQGSLDPVIAGWLSHRRICEFDSDE